MSGSGAIGEGYEEERGFDRRGKLRETFAWKGCYTGCKIMKMSDQDDWSDENAHKDATWEMLGKAAPRKASGRFADDTLRAVKLLPEADPWWPMSLRFSPWVAITACVALAALLFLNPAEHGNDGSSTVAHVSDDAEQWIEIETIAEEEVIAAAADHLDRFSDQELVTLIGF